MTMKNGVVVFLDSLGTKSCNDEETEDFCKKKEAFLKDANDLWKIRQKQFNKDLGLGFHLPEPEIATFQDSIIICWSDKEQTKEFLPLYLSAGQWLIDAIPLAIGEYDLFFRGAISVGNYIFESKPNSVAVLGQAAYEAINCERFADWIGVIQTRHCKNEYELFLKSDAKRRKEKFNPKYYEFLFVKYPVPLHKGKKEELYASAWPFIACKIEKQKSISQVLLNKSHLVESENKPKYENAQKFFEWYKREIFPQIPKQ
jgi:hypothetical protein